MFPNTMTFLSYLDQLIHQLIDLFLSQHANERTVSLTPFTKSNELLAIS